MFLFTVIFPVKIIHNPTKHRLEYILRYFLIECCRQYIQIFIVVNIKMEKLKGLVNKRSALKGKLTRFSQVLNSLSANEIKLRYDRIQSLLDEFEVIQDQIENIDEANSEDNESQREIFENQFFTVLATAKAAMESVVQTKVEIKLPDLKLQEFNGDQRNWNHFIETFKALVHNNSALSNVQKYYYLQSCLKGEAAKIIANLEISELSYQTSWELLHERFTNLRAIVHKHIQTIFQLKEMKAEDQFGLRHLIDGTNVNLKALQNLAVPVEQWDSIIIYVISNKLDSDTRKYWEQTPIEGKLPTLKEFLKCLSSRAQTLELMQATDKKQSVQTKLQTGSSMHKRQIAAFVSVKKGKCNFCDKDHPIYYCKKFLNLKIPERLNALRESQACFRCLKPGHLANDCKATYKCRDCGSELHNTLLHKKEFRTESLNLDTEEVSVNNHSATGRVKKIVLLSTAMVGIVGKDENIYKARVLIDSGAQSNFMRAEFAKRLNLKIDQINKPISGIHNNVTHIRESMSVEMNSLKSDYKKNISCLILQEITMNIPQTTIPRSELKLPSGLELADPKFNISAPIDILLGAEEFWNILTNDRVKLDTGPTLQRTQLGWIISGPTSTYHKKRPVIETCNLSLNKISNQVEKFWKLEEVNTIKFQNHEEKACEASFLATHTRDEQGRFLVTLPSRPCINQLGNSLATAEKRFKNLERKLSSDKELKLQYVQFMKEYEELGHMEECDKLEGDHNSYFLPHHAVLKESSTTTKVRVVFDGSAKTSSGISLNDALMIGPVIQKDLYAQLLRFRRHHYVMTADIEKMYRQINVSAADRRLQKIVWRETPEEELRHYQLKTVTYGLGPSSFLATRCLQQIGMDNQNTFPKTSQVIQEDFYMDDLLTGGDDIQFCKELKIQLINLLQSAGMTLRKWRSNVLDLSSEAGQAGIAETGNFEKTPYDKSNNEKILGLIWNNDLDYFSYKITIPTSQTVSKRHILSSIASTFDPLGLLGPIIVVAKLIMQNLWQSKVSWDETLPSEILVPWRNYLEDLSQLNVLKIERKITCKDYISLQVHGFCDASEKAYGACIYIVTMDLNGERHSELITSKSRVAPLKCISLPKLELCSALLLAKLMKTVKQALDIMEADTHYWSDSTIALCWLKNQPARWNTFVANRVAEIQELSEPQNWRHVTSSDNAADILSRGSTAEKLLNAATWWHGPRWLIEESNTWPIPKMLCLNPPETKVKNVLLVTNADNWDLFEKFSSLIKLKRITAYLLRFKYNCNKLNIKRTGNLKVQELEFAFKRLIKLAQEHCFSSEREALLKCKNVNKNSSLKSLNPFLHEDLLCVGGRLSHSTHLTFQQKHPIILPARHKLTELIIRHYHYINLHAGTQALLSEIRLRFWPIYGKNTIKRILHKCLVCFRLRPLLGQQKMGNLPMDRIHPSRPFSVTGLDYAGPLSIKSGNMKKAPITKAYLCIFVCLATKAVHLELVTDLSSETFLNCLKRFIARRGQPKKIYSDNATNFKGACNKLKELYSSLKDNGDKIQKYLANKGMEWSFIPPHAPNQGGLWEAAVKSAKYHLHRITDHSILTFELLYTIICQIEACLNSRPLTPLSNDPNDLNPLTPNHFLMGTNASVIPELDVRNILCNRRDQYQNMTELIQSFWSRWKKDYLGELQRRNKWQTSSQRSLKKDDLVIVKEDNLPPAVWRMARVISSHPGSDGIVRVVTLKTSQGTCVRPITKTCLLPLEDNLEQARPPPPEEKQ